MTMTTMMMMIFVVVLLCNVIINGVCVGMHHESWYAR